MYIWFFIGILLLILEACTLSFFLIFFGLSALFIGTLLLFFELSLTWQILLFSLFSSVFCFAGKKMFRSKETINQDVEEEIIGKVAIALEDNQENSNFKVILGDTPWMAYSSFKIQKNQKVYIKNISNLTLEVVPYDHSIHN